MLTEDLPLESSLEGYLVRQVKALGGVVWKFTSPGVKGVPDRLVILPGRPTAYLELKRFGEEPEPLQYKRISDLEKRGAVAGWASTKEGVDAFLAQAQGVSYGRA